MATYVSPTKYHVLAMGKRYNFTHTERHNFRRQELKRVFEQKYFVAIFDAELNFMIMSRNGWTN